MDEKVQANTEKLRPKNIKDLRSFLEANIQMNRFIPNLADLCDPLRPYLKRDKDWIWEADHEIFLNENKASKKW